MKKNRLMKINNRSQTTNINGYDIYELKIITK